MLTVTHDLRTLDTLPWPHGLGKAEYRRLEWRMAALLGPGHCERSVHKRAFSDNPEYRAVLLDELGKTRWSSDVVDTVASTVEMAQQAPLLGVPLTDDELWCSWARTRGVSNPFVRSWLITPPDISGDRFGDGRHRITYLRLMCPPSTLVLVRWHDG